MPPLSAAGFIEKIVACCELTSCHRSRALPPPAPETRLRFVQQGSWSSIGEVEMRCGDLTSGMATLQGLRCAGGDSSEDAAAQRSAAAWMRSQRKQSAASAPAWPAASPFQVRSVYEYSAIYGTLKMRGCTVVTTLAPPRSSHASMLGCRQRAVTHGSSSTKVARSQPLDSACARAHHTFTARQSTACQSQSPPCQVAVLNHTDRHPPPEEGSVRDSTDQNLKQGDCRDC